MTLKFHSKGYYIILDKRNVYERINIGYTFNIAQIKFMRVHLYPTIKFVQQ